MCVIGSLGAVNFLGRFRWFSKAISIQKLNTRSAVPLQATKNVQRTYTLSTAYIVHGKLNMLIEFV